MPAAAVGAAASTPALPLRGGSHPAAAAPGVSSGFGAYLHIPFCAERCDYCAFATWTDRGQLVDAYVAAVLSEIRHAREGGMPAPSTVFVGGGTPSMLAGEDLAQLGRALEPRPGAEVSVECNPESTSPALLEHLAAAGVTRISLGVQSLVEPVLAGLGRSHRPGSVARAVAAIGAVGFASFNVDLVYGGAGETDENWLESLRGVLAFESAPPHVSAYALTVEPGTPLWRDPSRHPDDDVLAHRYELADEVLSAAGLGWYEISNWALPGHECRHNRGYWDGTAYRGFGCAAHSYVAGRRFWNLRRPERYIAAIEAGRSPVVGVEDLSPESAALESLALALRTRDGVPADALAADPSLDGLVLRVGGRSVLTRRGRLLANEVALRLQPG